MSQTFRSRKPRRDLKPWIGAVITGLALAGCGRAPSPPENAPRALVLGAVNSPVYDELSKTVRMVPYTGTQKAAEHDLVILDADAQSPQAVQKNLLVREALRAGKAVLLMDATEAHKREGLGQSLGFASKHTSPGYLARLTHDKNGRPEVRVVDFPSREILKPYGEAGAEPVSASTPGAAASFTGQVLATLNAWQGGVQDGYSPYPCGGNPNTVSGTASGGVGSMNEVIPAGAFYKHVFYCVPVQWQTGGTFLVKGSQNVYFNTNYTFTIILDNGNEPQGNFQYVVAGMDVTANPSGTPSSGAQPILSNSKSEKGWFQDRIQLSVQPVNTSLFQSDSDSPSNTNNQTQVTTTTNFSVSYTAPKSLNVTGSYSNSRTFTLPDWQVTNKSVGVNKFWDFKTVNPIDADNLGKAFSSWTGAPNTPNGLSMNQLQFSAQSAWRTQGVQTGWVDFNASTVQDVADIAYVCDNSDPEYPTCLDKHASGGVSSPVTLSVYMGAVVPVPIQAITFSQNPAPVVTSGSVTGTIVLAAAAPEDITIPLSSTDEAHASVPPSVTVKQGDTSATFTVNIASNGLAVGNTATAQIAAFYAQNYQAALNVRAVASTDLPPPASAPSYDPQQWAQNVPFGKWVAGYKVRYAVSFVGPSGETNRGPWSDWISGPYALPLLTNIATDPTGRATRRNIYRQFIADYNFSDPSAGVTLVGTLNDNTTTTLADDNY